MRIIVTGSTGIIGKQVINNLKLIYPNSEIFELNRTNILNTKNALNYDILNLTYVEVSKLIHKIKPDLIFHLAWYTNHKDYLSSSLNKSWEVATINLINAFYNSGGNKFIGLGSSIEYNWKEKNPFKEDCVNLNGNKWPYGEAKANVFNYLNNLEGASFQWDRVFFVFGPGQSKTRLIPLIIDNAINGGNPLKVNLKLRRDYISTFEIAKQVTMMSTCNHTGSINICSGNAPSIQELISHVESITNKKISISKEHFIDPFEIESLSGCIDVILKYFPNYFYDFDSLRLDLERTVQYYKSL